ncbi:unnamed protein product, partial [Brassica rapa subsp. trilocularis]
MVCITLRIWSQRRVIGQLEVLIMSCGINVWVIRRFLCFQIYLLFLNLLARVHATLVF